MIRLVVWLAASVLIVGCASGPPPLAPSPVAGAGAVTGELDAACMRGLATCELAARRYAALEVDGARRRRAEMLYQRCRRRGRGCRRLAELYASGGLPPPGRRRFGALYARMCGGRAPRDPGACAAGAIFARRCDGGDGAACGALAGLVEAGRLDGGALASSAEPLRRRACDQGHGGSCVRLAARLTGQRARWLQRGCDAGRAEACASLAELHLRGRGVEIDVAAARALYEKACEGGAGGACFVLAELVRDGRGGNVDRRGAVARYRQGCEQGAPRACEAWGRITEHGRGVEADPARAYELYQRAAEGYRARCEASQAAACVRLGVLAEEGSGMRSGRGRARELWQKGCEAGVAEGCLRLAMRGERVDRSALARSEALERRCDEGHGEACMLLAFLGKGDALERGCAAGHGRSCAAAALDEAVGSDRFASRARRACALGDGGGCFFEATAASLRGLDRDPAAAFERLLDGCRWGYAPACTRAGVLRLRGELRHDPLAAESLLRKGCERGDPSACYELGALKLRGARVPRDLRGGRLALERSCRAGSPEGCGHLGLLLMRGRHLTRDASRGASLMRDACSEGDDGACLDLAESLESGSQIERDTERAQALIARAAVRAEGRCDDALIACRSETTEALEARWRVEDGRLRRELLAPPFCGAELERTCNAAREALRRLCVRDASRCWDAATLVRRMAGAGLAGSEVAAEDVEDDAVRWARPACARGEARACAVMHRAHEQGRGVEQDAAEAERYGERACSLDADHCP